MDSEAVLLHAYQETWPGVRLLNLHQCSGANTCIFVCWPQVNYRDMVMVPPHMCMKGQMCHDGNHSFRLFRSPLLDSQIRGEFEGNALHSQLGNGLSCSKY